MKAILLNQDKSLRWDDVPISTLKPDEVLVKVVAAAIFDDFSSVDINKLQRRLEEGNVMIHFPDELIPKSEGGEHASADGHI